MARISRDQFLDLRPFRASPAFARLWIGSTLAGLGGQLTIVAVMRGNGEEDEKFVL